MASPAAARIGRQDRPKHIAALSTQRRANANLARTSCTFVGKESVKSYANENKRERAKE